MREPFILTYPPDENGVIHMPDDEAAHLLKVLRFAIGDIFIAFDGCGRGWRAEIVSVDKKKAVTARVLSDIPRSLDPLPIDIAVGSIKGPRMDWAVEKAAELGAAKFIPLKSRYAVVEPGEGRARRWKNIALAAAKQSRRLSLMEISNPLSVVDIPFQKYDQTMVFDLDINDSSSRKSGNNSSSSSTSLVIIGPEGGFSQEEREIFRANDAEFFSLGAHPLRTETAVTAALTFVRFACKCQ